jgi:hypothetical protein
MAPLKDGEYLPQILQSPSKQEQAKEQQAWPRAQGPAVFGNDKLDRRSETLATLATLGIPTDDSPANGRRPLGQLARDGAAGWRLSGD